MKNHPSKLLVVDIDGTLVNKDGKISAEDREAIAKVRDLDIQVTLSTGRGTQATLNIIDQLSLDGHHIFCDGALVSNIHQDEEVYAEPISQAVVKQMIDFAHQHGIDLELFSATRYFAERETWSTEAHHRFFSVEATLIDFYNIWEQERIIKGGVVTTTPQEVAKGKDFYRQFKNRLHFSYAKTPAYPSVDFINLLSPGVSKGKALEALASHLGIPLAVITAVGDGTNDISLLTSAGLAIAMGNAPDEVKAVANHVTLDIEHSGLSAAINKFLLGK